MKITILSGGSGNDALIRGIKQFNKTVDVKVITNAYDSGKSTGICRHITNTLGVSDIRKNHFRMYSSVVDYVDKSIHDFYEARYDFDTNNLREELLNKIHELSLDKYQLIIDAINGFCNIESSKNYEYKSFNIANIVYSYLYSTLGYEKTNEYFCKLLNIDDFVLLNSFDNVYIQAKTKNNYLIKTEGELVEFCNDSDEIRDIIFVEDELVNNSKPALNQTLNNKVIDRILTSDIIIISTGTFWSSIYPTIVYGKLYDVINNSTAKKFWIMNNEYDKDSYNITDRQFYNYFKGSGLDIDKFIIFENKDSIDDLHTMSNNANVVFEQFGNDNGKHNSDLIAYNILLRTYNLHKKFDYYMFDFDDTIKQRDGQNHSIYQSNIDLISKLKSKCIIVSGNNFDTFPYEVRTLSDTVIWADAFANAYKYSNIINKNTHAYIPLHEKTFIKNILSNSDDVNIKDSVIKIRPVDKHRELITNLLNKIFRDNFINCEAHNTGRSSIDILVKDSKKSDVIKLYMPSEIFYAGDELDFGNDTSVKDVCSNCINISSIFETNCILKLICKKLNIK